MEIGSADGPLHALAVFLHHYIVNCPDFKNKYVKAGLNLVVGWLLLPLKLLDAYTNRRHKSKYLLDANIYALGKK